MKNFNLFVIFLLFTGLVNEVELRRLHLESDRTPHWFDANDQNKGPFYGQPEQVHLSYGGRSQNIANAGSMGLPVI
jgi:hypothetical protein